MIKKYNLNFFGLNIFTFSIFNIYLFGLVISPFLVNIFIFSLIIIFILKTKENNSIYNIDFSIKLQILLCLYIILNSFFISDVTENMFKAIFYFRFFLIAFVISKILEINNKTLDYIGLCFLIFSIILSLDIFYQYITGFDIFGFKPGICSYPDGKYLPKNCERFSGFFGSELIAGNFLSTYGIFFLYLFATKFQTFRFKNLIISLSFLIIFFAIILSGERNAILALLIIFSFNLIFNKRFRKKLLFIFSFFILIFYVLFTNLDQVRYRYFEWPISYISSMESKGIKKFFETSWGSHYITAYEIFVNNKIFGSGFKSFRNECQDEIYSYENLNKKYDLNLKSSGCSTHPHNLYLEILSELGLIGFFIFMLILYFTIFHPFFKNLMRFTKEGEIIMSFSIILTFLFPFKPTGSFSASVFSTNMWFFIGFYLYFVSKQN